LIQSQAVLWLTLHLMAAMKQPLMSTSRASTQSKSEGKFGGFEKGEEVVFDAVGTIKGFTPTAVLVDIHGKTITVEHKRLRKADVGKFMKKVLQFFCGYMDVWFLRETFGGGPGTVFVRDRIEEEAEMIFHELDMQEWKTIHPVVKWSFGLYLRKILAPSVYMFQRHMKPISWALGAVLLLMFLYTLYGFANCELGNSDEQAAARGEEAFAAVEHAPVTPLVLLFCTHLILMMFATDQFNHLLQSSSHVSFPLTYPVLIGKSFMVFRMCLAYSSKNLGLSIDYFVFQEIILISIHACLAVFVGDPHKSTPEAIPGSKPKEQSEPPLEAKKKSDEKSLKGVPYAKQLAWACLVVFGIDAFKTLVMFVFWYNFKTGPLAFYFNRLPNIQVMLVASVFIHALLDMLQAAVTMFTMFIGKMFVAFTTDDSLDVKQVQEAGKSAGEQMADKVIGQWQTPKGYVTISEKYWMVQVPEGIEPGQRFIFPTVYKLNVPSIYMGTTVPENLSEERCMQVLELRVTNQFYGTSSVDAARLSDTTLDYLLPTQLRTRYYSSGFFIEHDSKIKFEGSSFLYGEVSETWSKVA